MLIFYFFLFDTYKYTFSKCLTHARDYFSFSNRNRTITLAVYTIQQTTISHIHVYNLHNSKYIIIICPYIYKKTMFDA